jgi:[ribosomal protein S18]-alanine N-acetyltransferase
MIPDPAPFTIRPYLKADLARLHAIDQACFPPAIAYSLTELRFYLSGRKATGLVAEVSHLIAGFAVGRTEKNGLAHVITLDVLPGARRQGIGRALMEGLHAEFSRRGATHVILEVSVDNPGARRFYEKLGYRFVEILPGYYNGETDACLMIRPAAGAPAMGGDR